MAHLVIDSNFNTNTKKNDSTDYDNASFRLFDIMDVNSFVVIWSNAPLVYDQRPFCKNTAT